MHTDSTYFAFNVRLNRSDPVIDVNLAENIMPLKAFPFGRTWKPMHPIWKKEKRDYTCIRVNVENYRELWFASRLAWRETFNTSCRSVKLESKANFGGQLPPVIVPLTGLIAEIEWWEQRAERSSFFHCCWSKKRIYGGERKWAANFIELWEKCKLRTVYRLWEIRGIIAKFCKRKK